MFWVIKIKFCHSLACRCKIHSCVFSYGLAYLTHSNCFYEKRESVFVSVVSKTKSLKDVRNGVVCCFNFIWEKKNICTFCDFANFSAKIDVVSVNTVLLCQNKTAVLPKNIASV